MKKTSTIHYTVNTLEQVEGDYILINELMNTETSSPEFEKVLKMLDAGLISPSQTSINRIMEFARSAQDQDLNNG